MIIFPNDELFDNLEQTLSFNSRLLFRQSVAWIIDELCKQDCSARCEWTPRPPCMEIGRVSRVNVLLMFTGRIDGVERQGDLNEFFAVIHSARASKRVELYLNSSQCRPILSGVFLLF